MHNRKLWVSVSLFVMVSLAAVAVAVGGEEDSEVRGTVERFWTAFSSADAGTLRSLAHSPWTAVEVSSPDGGKEHVFVNHEGTLAREMRELQQAGKLMRMKLSPIEVRRLSRNTAFATYTATLQGKDTAYSMVTLLVRTDGTWRVATTTVPM